MIIQVPYNKGWAGPGLGLKATGQSGPGQKSAGQSRYLNPAGQQIPAVRDKNSASDQNSNMPFLRNEFSKIFEDLFTITLFPMKTHISDQTKN